MVTDLFISIISNKKSRSIGAAFLVGNFYDF